MELALWLIFAGVVLIDLKLWKLILEQGRHDKSVETLLREIRDQHGRAK